MNHFPFAAFFAVFAAAASTVTTATGPALTANAVRFVVRVYQTRFDTIFENQRHIETNLFTSLETKIKKE